MYPSSGGSGGMTELFFQANQGFVPAASFARYDTRNAIPVLNFTTDEIAFFGGKLPNGYQGGSLVIELEWMAASATTGDATLSVAFERHDEGTDLDADSFATAKTVTTNASATSGTTVYSTITFTAEELDGLQAGEHFRAKVTVSAKTMAGDLQLLSLSIRES